MLTITPSLFLDESELVESFVRASGPGGQNVNKVATAVQLRFDVAHSASLPQEVRARLLEIAANRITDEGVLVIDARRFRTQEQNRADARERLRELILRALQKPKARRATKPTRAAQARRVENKRARSRTKALRQKKLESE
jgi:ribosome-associated protein